MARELAILVTARNMASGVLKDVKGDIRGIQSEASRGAQNIIRNVGIATVAVGGLAATQVKAGLESLAELERVTAQTNAALKSTGSTAAGTVADIRARAEALEDLTTVDDKVIQNAENVLLTFTAIREDAFEPTLKAALDMNAALGGDDDSLQQVLIQVGKAVNDPIRGMTSLRRVGVSFTKQQEDQVKAMVAAGDAAGAQALILAELNKEFGGSAAAQADTYGGKMRKLQDAVEGAQMALATAFLPVLEKVSDKLQDFLSDPNTLKNIEGLGQTLADGFDDALAIVERLPWDAIGSTFSLIGQGTKAALDMFTGLPDWVQTAVLTGWGLNKLSGGALGNIVGALGSGLIKGVLGMNAGVVNINAAMVNGGGLPGVAGGAPVAGGAAAAGGVTVAGVASLLTGAVLSGVAVKMAADFDAARDQSQSDLATQLRDMPTNTARATAESISKVQLAIAPEGLNPLEQILFDTNVKPTLEDGLADLKAIQQQQAIAQQAGNVNAQRDAAITRNSVINEFRTGRQAQQRQADQRAGEASRAASSDRAMLATAATQAARLSTIQGIESGNSGKLTGILAKKSSVNVNVNATVNVSVAEWQRTAVANARANSNSGGYI